MDTARQAYFYIPVEISIGAVSTGPRPGRSGYPEFGVPLSLSDGYPGY